MKILYVQQHFATGGGEAGVRGYHLVKTLAARGHEVTVVCGVNWRDSSLQTTMNKDGKPQVEMRRIEDFNVVQLPVFYSNQQSFFRRIRSFLKFGVTACREVARRDADLVFASSTPLTVSFPALWACVIKRRPYILEVRDLWPDFPIEMGIIRNPLIKKLLYLWERIAYAYAARLVALAPGTAAAIQRKANVPRENIIMIPNGSDTTNLTPLGARRPRVHLPMADDKIVFGYAGTHGVANGLDAVLDAAAVLQKRGRANEVEFVLIGDGREKPRLIKRAKREDLSNVRFVGLFNKRRYNEVLCELDVGMQLLQNIKGFYYGSSPNKFFDYLAVGKPVLVNYPGWMSELVTANDCGVTVAPDDAEKFADAVEQLLARRDEWAAMGARARALAEREFSQQKILPELAAFIEAIPLKYKTGQTEVHLNHLREASETAKPSAVFATAQEAEQTSPVGEVNG